MVIIHPLLFARYPIIRKIIFIVMKSSHIRQALLGIALCISFAAVSQDNLPQTKSYSPVVSTRTISFDNAWLFMKDSTIHAEMVNYNDATWRMLDLPHDWSIEDLP